MLNCYNLHCYLATQAIVNMIVNIYSSRGDIVTRESPKQDPKLFGCLFFMLQQKGHEEVLLVC